MRRGAAGRRLLAAVVAGAALAAAAPAVAAVPQRKTVTVNDDYFGPQKLTLRNPATVTWKWPADEAIDRHDVKLESAPRGVERWQSRAAAGPYRFKRTLRTPGRYRIVCTLHAGMTMTITVRR